MNTNNINWQKGSYVRVVYDDMIVLGVVREYRPETREYHITYYDWDYGWYPEERMYKTCRELMVSAEGKELEERKAAKSRKLQEELNLLADEMGL